MPILKKKISSPKQNPTSQMEKRSCSSSHVPHTVSTLAQSLQLLSHSQQFFDRLGRICIKSPCFIVTLPKKKKKNTGPWKNQAEALSREPFYVARYTRGGRLPKWPRHWSEAYNFFHAISKNGCPSWKFYWNALLRSNMVRKYSLSKKSAEAASKIFPCPPKVPMISRYLATTLATPDPRPASSGASGQSTAHDVSE